MLAGCLLGLSWPAQSAPEPLPPVPISAFVADSVFQRPLLSPDGQRLAVVVNAPQGDRSLPTLIVFEVPSLKQVAQMRMPFGEVPIEHHWLGNNRLLISNGLELGRFESPLATGSIFATDIDGRNQKHLSGAGRKDKRTANTDAPRDSGYGVVHLLPDPPNGRFYLLDQRREDGVWRSVLFDVDGATGDRVRMATSPMEGFGFVLQRDGRPAFTMGVDEKNEPRLYRYDEARKWVEMTPAKAGEAMTPYGFLPDGMTIYGALTVDNGPVTLVREAVDGTGRVTLAQHPVGSIDMLLRGGRPRQPFAAASSLGRPSPQYFDETSPDAQLHKLISAQFPGEIVDFLSFSEDGSRVLFSVFSDRDPSAYYLLERSTMKAHELFSPMPGIDPQRMGERRPIAFKARDGLELHGYLTLPAGSKPDKLPLVLLPHGGPHGVTDDWFFDADAQFLASRGYAVLQVNYRGSGGRGRKFRESGYRQWADKIQDDLIDAVRWAEATGVSDPARVGVYGASFGAYSAMQVVAREPSMFRCAVGLAGLYDVPMWTKPDRERFKKDEQVLNLLDRYVGDDLKEQARISPTQHADRIKVPVLLVHGEFDGVAPLEQGEAMRDALKRVKRPPEWVEVAGEGHGFYARKNQEDFYRRLEGFLARHMGPGATTPVTETARP